MVTCVDLTASLGPVEDADQPPAAHYDQLARFGYRADDLELMLVPRAGRPTSLYLTPAQIETSQEFCRRMVAIVREVSGGFCDYGPPIAVCPAYLP